MWVSLCRPGGAFGKMNHNQVMHTALQQLGDSDPWAAEMPAPQQLPADLVEEGRAIPAGRVQAMHEGKRRARSRRT